jgi:AraC-like DNA-binding protein
MENKVIKMGNLSKHIGHMPRNFCSSMPVDTIGIVPCKKERVKRVFDSFNFSFILEGTGTYIYQEKEYKVNAPCVITQFPEESMDYGPYKTWYEVFLIYPSYVVEFLQKRNFFSQDKPIWNISNPDKILKLLTELKTALTTKSLNPDRIDYLCEGMIMESLLAQSSPPETVEEGKISAIKSYLRNNFSIKHDYTQLAREYGMSLSTFRRYWLKHTGVPPAKYQSDLLIQEACRLLIEKKESIKEIAAMLNFDDPLYFTKKFHKETGTTPTQYRKQHAQFII